MKARIPNIQSNNQAKMMQQLNEMQAKIEAKQEEIYQREFSAVSGGNAVKVTFNGKRKMLDLDIQDYVINSDDKEMMQDLIVAAVNSCLNEITDTTEKEMDLITGGISLPGII